MSVLRARCPDCRTLTAVALGGDYQCHACGREFGAGLVRVPRVWWEGAEATADAAWASLPWPEAAVIEEETLEAQVEAQARASPARPLVLGGCRWAHVGAIRALARRGPLGVVWLDARDLDPPEPDVLPERFYVAVEGEVAAAGDLEILLASLPRPAGAGFTGLRASEGNAAAVTRLAHALGL